MEISCIVAEEEKSSAVVPLDRMFLVLIVCLSPAHRSKKKTKALKIYTSFRRHSSSTCRMLLRKLFFLYSRVKTFIRIKDVSFVIMKLKFYAHRYFKVESLRGGESDEREGKVLKLSEAIAWTTKNRYKRNFAREKWMLTLFWCCHNRWTVVGV